MLIFLWSGKVGTALSNLSLTLNSVGTSQLAKLLVVPAIVIVQVQRNRLLPGWRRPRAHNTHTPPPSTQYTHPSPPSALPLPQLHRLPWSCLCNSRGHHLRRLAAPLHSAFAAMFAPLRRLCALDPAAAHHCLPVGLLVAVGGQYVLYGETVSRAKAFCLLLICGGVGWATVEDVEVSLPGLAVRQRNL